MGMILLDVLRANVEEKSERVAFAEAYRDKAERRYVVGPGSERVVEMARESYRVACAELAEAEGKLIDYAKYCRG